MRHVLCHLLFVEVCKERKKNKKEQKRTKKNRLWILRAAMGSPLLEGDHPSKMAPKKNGDGHKRAFLC